MPGTCTSLLVPALLAELAAGSGIGVRGMNAIVRQRDACVAAAVVARALVVLVLLHRCCCKCCSCCSRCSATGSMAEARRTAWRRMRRSCDVSHLIITD